MAQLIQRWFPLAVLLLTPIPIIYSAATTASLFQLSMTLLMLFFRLPLFVLLAIVIVVAIKHITPKRYRHTILSIGIVLICLFSIYALTSDGFQSLPQGATNGEWAARAVAESNPFLFSSIHDLVFDSVDARLASPSAPVSRVHRVVSIVRAEVIDVQSKTVISCTSEMTTHLYSIYQIRVMDVYGKGVLSAGDVVDVRQLKQLEGMIRMRRWLTGSYPFRNPSELELVHGTRVPLVVGDDLILFLGKEVREGWSVYPRRHGMVTHYVIASPIQGIYRYTSQEIRGYCENWEFEPVNPHNNLILTVADLQHIRSMWELDTVKRS